MPTDYPSVTVQNTTDYVIQGEVHYLSLFCKNDVFSRVQPHTVWEGPGRGVCLVTKIEAHIDGAEQYATPYESSGTAYSKFAVINLDDGSFEVTRRVQAGEDEPPPDYVEPTEEQK